MDFENPNREIQQDFHPARQLCAAVLASLIVHGIFLLLILWVMDQRSQNRQPLSPVTVSINLLPPPQMPETQPQRRDSLEPDSNQLQPLEFIEEAVEAINTQAVESGSFEPAEPQVERTVTAGPVVDVPPPAKDPRPLTDNQTDPDSGRFPDRLTLRQAVRTVREGQSSAVSGASSCTVAQQRNNLIDCPELTEPDYSDVVINPVYLSFNPPAADDTSRRAMGTITDNQLQLRAGIQTFNQNGIATGYLLEELTQSIEVYSGSGNTRLERLSEQIYRNDPAYQTAQRIMNPR